jgi:hypothetical protein
VLAVALILILSGVAYFAPQSSNKIVTQPPGYHRLTFRRGPIQSARFTPDGQTIVYSAAFEGQTPELYQTRPDAVESRLLGIKATEIVSISRTGEMLILERSGKHVLSHTPTVTAGFYQRCI